MASLTQPRRVLRVGVAGAIRLGDDQRLAVAARLTRVFGVLLRGLESSASGSAPSTLRLVSGLADGTDQLAFQTLLGLRGASPTTVRHELVAVLPTDAATFRDNSAVRDRAAFDAFLARSDHVIELDACCPPEAPPDAPDPLASERRDRTFRVQSAVLLRQCDVLIAVADPDLAGAAGGTRETMAGAVSLGTPVIFIASTAAGDSDGIRVIRRPTDLERLRAGRTAEWEGEVAAVVARVLADPVAPEAGDGTGGRAADAELLGELLGGTPPATGVQARLWSLFERRIVRLTEERSDLPLEPFAAYARRAGELAAAYGGLYRGAFLVNYGLAVVAVGLAVSTLLVLLWDARHGVPERATSLALVTIASLELVVLLTIFLNTHRGNRNGWNAKAVNARYVAERLRALYYVAPLACLRVAPPRATRYASTGACLGVADWLLQAVVREAPPDTGLVRRGDAGSHRTAAPDVPRALAAIRAHWLEGQIAYHRGTSSTQFGIHRSIERWVWRLSVSVIMVVAIDLLMLSARTAGTGGAWLDVAHAYAPLLVFVAAVVPACMASLNGIAFQSECLRIAERSAVMAGALTECRDECERLESEMTRARASGDDPGAWTLEALELAERCAQLTCDDVAEWSVLYSRDLLEV